MSRGAQSQQGTDRLNEEFWNELCGSGMAKALGITHASAENLARFDDAYMGFYPYLWRYVAAGDLQGCRVLEIGLGYGTLGNALARHAGEYHGVDIAGGPVMMMQYRLALLGRRETALRASVLDLPYRDGAFDVVYSIGCLHHTGDVGRGISEIHRVLVSGGRAVIMLYNRHSFRRLVQAPAQYLAAFRSGADRAGFQTFLRGLYDTNLAGQEAPHTDFLSRRQLRRLFRRFSRVRIESQNFDTYVLFKGRLVIPRERLLGTLGRVLGLDLYVVATK